MGTMTGSGITGSGITGSGMTGQGASGVRLRVTRRGRAVLVLTVMVLLVLAGMTLGRGSSQAASHATAGRTLTVQPGDTLWTVAARVAPHQDPRLVIAGIEAANRLHGVRVLAGQQLVIPAIG